MWCPLSIWHQLNFLQLFQLPSCYCCCFICHSFNQCHRHYQHHNKFHPNFCWIILRLKYHEWWPMINLLCNTVEKSSRLFLMLLCTVLTHWSRVTHIYVSDLGHYCRLFGAKPLPEPMRVKWTLENKAQWNLKQSTRAFCQENASNLSSEK